MRKIRLGFEKQVQNCSTEAIEKYEQCLRCTYNNAGDLH